MLITHICRRTETGIFRFLMLALLVLATGCSRERTYDVQGRVAGFGDDAHTLIVEHEDIPGLMPAMTMPFDVLDSTSVESLAVGDAIAFQLSVTGERAWIDDITVLPDDAVAEHPAGRPDAFQPNAERILDRGDRVPDAQLLTHADTTLQLASLRGRRVVITFIYTECPIPDFCPLMSRRFAELQPALDRLSGPPTHLLSISFDPSKDTPAVLRDYAQRYTSDLSNWTFATGDEETIDRLANRFGVFYRTDAEQIIHNLVTVLVDVDGHVREIWRGNEWQADDVLEALEASNG